MSHASAYDYKPAGERKPQTGGRLRAELVTLVCIASLPSFAVLVMLGLRDTGAHAAPLDQYPLVVPCAISLALAAATAWWLGGQWLSRAGGFALRGARPGADDAWYDTDPPTLQPATVTGGAVALLDPRERRMLAGNRRLAEAQDEVRRLKLACEHHAEERSEYVARIAAQQHRLFDSMPQLVWMTDPDGAVTFANRVWSDRIGITEDDWAGDGWSRALHPEDFERVSREWAEAVTRQEPFEMRFRLLHRDDDYHHYQIAMRREVDDAGATTSWVGIADDMTVSRRRDNALRFANQEVLAFTSAIAHELRAPLQVVAGFGERLEKESGARLDTQGGHYLALIRDGAQTMQDRIDDLLNISHVTRAEMTVVSLDLSALARRVFDALRQQAPERAVEFVVREGMIAIGDTALLQVLFENLIGNALKFTMRQPAPRIEVGEIPQAGNTSTFFVRDNGAGFDQAQAHKLFGLFHRLHGAQDFPGRGMGLATVQRIVHRHGGRTGAEGVPGEGATVYFTLRRE